MTFGVSTCENFPRNLNKKNILPYLVSPLKVFRMSELLIDTALAFSLDLEFQLHFFPRDSFGLQPL